MGLTNRARAAHARHLASAIRAVRVASRCRDEAGHHHQASSPDRDVKKTPTRVTFL